MKRIKDNPLMSKKYSEGASPIDGEVIPRSGDNEGETTSFPIYLTHIQNYPQKLVYSNNLPIINFSKCINGVYEGEIILSHFSKGGKENDKIRCYDKVTGAYFSMDVESIYELLSGVADGTFVISHLGDEMSIKGIWTMRGHFLMPYSKRYEKELMDEVQKQQNDKKRKLKPSEYIDGCYYKDKNGYEYQWFEKPITIYEKREWKSHTQDKIVVDYRTKRGNKIRLSYIGAEDGARSWAYEKISPSITLEDRIKAHNEKEEKSNRHSKYFYSLTPFK